MADVIAIRATGHVLRLGRSKRHPTANTRELCVEGVSVAWHANPPPVAITCDGKVMAA